jgi:hypothetical protein
MLIKELLQLNEMSTTIAEIEPSKRRLKIQINTSNQKTGGGGRTEHYPAHLHIKYRDILDIPIDINTKKFMVGKHSNITGKLTKKEKEEIDWFIDYYGVEELSKIFDAAMRAQDPEPLFKMLQLKKEKEQLQNYPDDEDPEELIEEYDTEFPRITSVVPKNGNTVELIFNTGLTGELIFTEEFFRGWWAELKDPEVFNSVHAPDTITVAWNNGFDLSSTDFLPEIIRCGKAYYG